MINSSRMTTQIDGDFAYFLIGMVINKPPFGLGKASKLLEARSGLQSASGRLHGGSGT